jgi:D-sedoheptulose 7-phosphate isomerase
MNSNQLYLKKLQEALDRVDFTQVDTLINWLHDARLNGNQVFLMGNGGSATTASHFTCDLAKATRCPGWPSFRVIGLTDNMAVFSAYANDEGYESVFANQLASFVKPQDIVIAISGSGNSMNVVNAIQLARSYGARTIGMTGFDGGKVGQLVDLNIHVPCNQMEIVEDIHLMMEHMVSYALRQVTMTGSVEIEESDLAKAELPAPVYKPTLNHSIHGTLIPVLDDPVALLTNLSSEMAEQFDLHGLLIRAMQITLTFVRATSGTIIVLNESGNVVDGALALGGQVVDHPIQRLVEIYSQGLAGWVVQHREAALIDSTLDDPRWLQREWEDQQKDSRSAISVPLMTPERVVGVVTLVHPEPGHFRLEDMALLIAVSQMISYSFKLGGVVAESQTL